jgi:NTP pyrophosphatase (non-canonical NTP hydrolase)
MQFSEYQQEAARTDQLEIGDVESKNDPLLVPLLGLAGEAGQLLTELKKYFISGDDRSHLVNIVKEELGDILWYVSNIADKFQLDLDDVAFSNLVKVQNRWPMRGDAQGSAPRIRLFDEDAEPGEQLPRYATLKFEEREDMGRNVVRISFVAGDRDAGDPLTDNAYEPDGYRFHDAFHIAYAAILGWSPVLRKVWKRKRKSDKRKDEVEDGGRASVIEEGIAALVFSDAKERQFYENTEKIDSEILRTIKNMTAHLEVSIRSYKDWQAAIFDGYRLFRALRANGGGYVTMDMLKRKADYYQTLDAIPSLYKTEG